MTSFTILNNGCEALQCDANEIMNVLGTPELVFTESVENADVVVFFCCTFTQEREDDTINRIKGLLTLKKKTVISGCFLPHMVDLFPTVDYVRKKDLAHYLSVFLKKDRAVKIVPNCLVKNDVAILNIASGCFGKCAYCSIKNARGRFASIPEEHILGIIGQNQDKLVRLVAQDVSAYGMDFGSSLLSLLDKIWTEYPDVRIELGTLNVHFLKHYSQQNFEVFKRLEGVINLPLQTASNRLLELMRREYTFEEYLYVYNSLTSIGCKVSMDIMSGLPTETEEEHKMNLDFLKEHYFDFAQIFMFEPRPKTVAASMQQVNQEIKEKRTIELLSQYISTYIKKNNCSLDVLTEKLFYNTNIKIN